MINLITIISINNLTLKPLTTSLPPKLIIIVRPCVLDHHHRASRRMDARTAARVRPCVLVSFPKEMAGMGDVAREQGSPLFLLKVYLFLISTNWWESTSFIVWNHCVSSGYRVDACVNCVSVCYFRLFRTVIVMVMVIWGGIWRGYRVKKILNAFVHIELTFAAHN